MTREALHVGRRTLGREHFAWYRGVLEGLAPAVLWERYLALEGDYSEPLAHGTMQWIRQELLTLARNERPALLGLLRRDPRRMKTARLPTLDEFAETLGDPDFYSQAELQELWRDQVGPRDARATERRQKLQDRLRTAIQDLETCYAKAPALPHPLAQWLVPALAQRLGAAGLSTLADLVDRRHAQGARWWVGIERLGEVGGTRLTGWLDEHFPALPSPAAPPSPAQLYGVTAVATLRAPDAAYPSSTATASSPSPSLSSGAPRLANPYDGGAEAAAAGIAPSVESADRDINGNTPALRPYSGASSVASVAVDAAIDAAPRSSIDASNDEAAIRTWLSAKATNPNSRRTYEREAQRLFLWCHQERGRGFRELMVEDCIAFRLWVSQLGRLTPEAWDAVGWRVPQSAWIGPRGPLRSSPEWRAFEGPLLHGSQAQAVRIASALFEFLRRGGYLAHPSPWGMIGKPALAVVPGDGAESEAPEDQFVARSFTKAQLAFLLDQARQRAPAGDSANTSPRPLEVARTRLARRLELILWLGAACGLRASEMCSLSLSSLRIDAGHGWRLRVAGKGGKTRTLPLPTPAVQATLGYLSACGIDEAQLHALVAARLKEPLLRVHANRARANSADTVEPVRLGYRGLYAALTKFLMECGSRLATSDLEGARRFNEASTHWLRHTFATLMIESGETLNIVQAMLGHGDLATTGRYVRAQQQTMQEAAERFAVSTGALRPTAAE